MVFDIFEGEENWPPELYAEFLLTTHYSFIKRIWIGLKYVFGYGQKHGHFDCWVLNTTDTMKLRELIDTYIKEYNGWLDEHKEDFADGVLLPIGVN